MTGEPAELDSTLDEVSIGEVYHGYRGPQRPTSRAFRPPISVAVNRQTGSRGRAVAQRAAELLGFAFFGPEALDFAAQDPAGSNSGYEFDPRAVEWVNRRMADLDRESPLSSHPEMAGLVRLMVELGAIGGNVLMGKGCVLALPAESTVRVRLIAPEADRIAYVAQWERYTPIAAQAHIREREESRRNFHVEKFGVDPDPAWHYDMVLNTSELGVEACAQLIVAAVRLKNDPPADGELS
jgi:hypothetical protein